MKNIAQFFKKFPTDEACLDHLFKERFGKEPACPKCGEIGKFRKLSKLPAYTCNCGHHIHPMVGTPFQRSSTPLQKWFYAMYLFTTSRHGVPAKELQRQLAVTYKTAWRMGHEIRKYMAQVDGDPPLSGDIEADETFIGGYSPGRKGPSTGKMIVMGMLERGGDVMMRHVPDLKRRSLQEPIVQNVKQGSTIHTDEALAYDGLEYRGYTHLKVKHRAKQYVSGRCHVNGIEGVWSQLKRSINGTHVHVSPKHLSKYLGEFEYRYNMRKSPELMFDRLLASF